MLIGQLGIRLVLWMGETVPRPAPEELIRSLTQVEVTNDVDEGDGFSLTFTLSRDLLGDYPVLQNSAIAAGSRVIIGVLLGVIPEVLIDGTIDHQQLNPSNEPGTATLTLMGKDLTTELDLEEKNAQHPNQPDSLIVTKIILSYAQFGLVPEVTPTTEVPLSLQRITRQQETDLQFIRRLAERNGFVFYIKPLTFGTNQAHWGIENRLSIPQPALSLNMGSATTIESLQFTNNSLAPTATQGAFVEPITRIRIPIPSLPSLRIPPLAAAPVAARRTAVLRDTANQNPAQAAQTAIATVTNASDAVEGEGELRTVRYGNVLRARQLVGVRGVGRTYDGNYLVKHVTHRISRGDYTQSFTVKREGTGTLLPVVRP